MNIDKTENFNKLCNILNKYGTYVEYIRIINSIENSKTFIKNYKDLLLKIIAIGDSKNLEFAYESTVDSLKKAETGGIKNIKLAEQALRVSN